MIDSKQKIIKINEKFFNNNNNKNKKIKVGERELNYNINSFILLLDHTYIQ